MDFMLSRAGLILISMVFLYICRVFRIPGIVAYFITGMLVGTYGPGILAGRIPDRDLRRDCGTAWLTAT